METWNERLHKVGMITLQSKKFQKFSRKSDEYKTEKMITEEQTHQFPFMRNTGIPKADIRWGKNNHLKSKNLFESEQNMVSR